MRLLLTVLLFTLTSLPPAQAASRFMLPQAPPAKGPWFEGWYVRVTDPTNHRSFATITTSSTHLEIPLARDTVLPGYLAFLYNRSPQEPTRSREFFPERTRMQIDGDGGADPRFRWDAEGYGGISEDDLHLKLPSGDEVEITFGPRRPWSKYWGDWGPEGIASFLPLLPLAWYVDSMGSPVTYRLHLAETGEVLEGRGFAHVEKNWGKVFPRAWMWSQATSEDNSAHLALAGGPLNLGVDVKTYLVGYKSDAVNFEFRPDQIPAYRYRKKIDPCGGNFHLDIANLRRRLVVSAHAPRASFAPVSMPTPHGYEPDQGMESFVAEIDVDAFLDGKLVEHRHFSGAALEFGAEYHVCPEPIRP